MDCGAKTKINLALAFMKIILPIEVGDELLPQLPSHTAVVRVDSEGNLDGDISDAEVYFSWYFLKPTTLDKIDI
ncbi:MAG: hypothetical protein F6K28_35145 [Microcoleus sp. SIO2G3]|nr:hypothetical protein [Microcoleus sp. SIO2G3]